MHPRETGRRYDAVAAQVDADLRESTYGVGFVERDLYPLHLVVLIAIKAPLRPA